VLARVVRGREIHELALRMRLASGEWRIVDVVVDGTSIAESNRAAFYREIRQAGIPGLLGKLRTKAAQPKGP
jgi:ABC-type transporter MlaC component